MSLWGFFKQCCLAGTLILIMVGSTLADVPAAITYQGRLTDDTGQPVADGNYQVTFAIYDVAVAGSSLWAETQTISTTDGLFTVLLGSVNPITGSLFDGSTRFLGLTIEGGSELLPRTVMVSVPFAFQAAQSDSSDAMTDGAIDLNDIGPNGAANGQVMKWNGSAWAVADDISGGAGWSWSDSSSYGPDTVGTAAGLTLPLVLAGNSNDYIFQITNNGTGQGLVSYNLGPGSQNRALYGRAENGTSSNQGVYGHAEADGGVKIGLNGLARGTGSNSGSYAIAENGEFNYGVSGIARGPVTNYGGEFKADDGTFNVGVFGRALGPGTNMGVRGQVAGGEYNYAISGKIIDAGLSAYNYGLYSSVEGAGFNYGVYAEALGGSTNWAGYFEGDVNISGNSVMGGNLLLKRLSPDNPIFEFDTENHRLKFYEFGSDEDRRLMEFSAFTGGDIKLYYQADTSKAITQLSAGPNGGEITVRDQNGNTRIFFRGNHSDISNNDRVILHEGSVDDVELMNEPGIAQARNSSCFTITATAAMEDVVVVTIDIPAPGYINLTGHGLVEVSGTVGANRIKAQIDETAGGAALNGFYTRIGLGAYVSDASTAFCDFDLNCHRVYYKSAAGTYTFRLEAVKESSFTAKICFATLTATYFSTSYGTVASAAGGHTETGQQADIDVPTAEMSLSSETIDLREQELQVREARRQELESQLQQLNDAENNNR